MNTKTIFLNRLFSFIFTLLLTILIVFSNVSPVFAQLPSGNSAAGASAGVSAGASAGKSWVMGGTFFDALKQALTKDGSTSLEATGNALNFININSGNVMMGGCAGLNPTDPNDPVCKQLNGASALTGVNNLIYAMVVTPPASTNLAILDFGKSLGFISPQAYAQNQGIGFAGLAPILPIWKGFRNIAYSILAIIMIVIGFMVMFRKKIDPKTVVTVQNALPGIIVTMILITFSYAIAGFMIDLMYLFTAVGISLLAPAGYRLGFMPVSTGAMQQGYLSNQEFLQGGFVALFTGVFGPILNVLNPFSGALSVVDSAAKQGLQFTNIIPGLISGTAQVGFQFTLVALGPLLIFIFLLIFLIAFFRIFFMLLSSYVNIIFAVITAPLHFLLGALPGGNGFGSWVKNMFSNLVAFPITILVLIIANWLGSSANSADVNALWVPPLLPQPGGGGGNAISSFAYTIIWLGMVFGIPGIVGSIKEALKAKSSIPVGVGAITGPIGGGLMQGLQMGYYGSQVGSFFRHGKTEPNPLTSQMEAIAAGNKDILGKLDSIKSGK